MTKTAHVMKLAAITLLVVSLAACGGSGGGGGTNFIPPPPPPPPPPVAAIGAPAIAVAPNGSLFPDAVTGGPTLQDQSTTTFPLLQTAVTISPGNVAASSATMNGGATLAFDFLGNANTNSFQFNVENPALTVSNAQLTYQNTPNGNYGSDLTGGGTAGLELFNLSWSAYGFWDVDLASGTQTHAAFVTGYETPGSSVPTTGSATFHGFASARTYHPLAGEPNSVAVNGVSGDATLQANFGNGTITGSLTNMLSDAPSADWELAPWNSVSLVGAISGGHFTGTSAATSAPNNIGALSGSATGTFAGKFFGPSAQELGAVWTLFDGTSSAIGIIGATSTPDDNPWDY